ncbi:Mbov_0392 family ICE element protein, partial [Mycoplasmopsis bovis]|uniref:Mbov_0392 family ICE element protein n=1 Tax=Mycoplasmopsis bovis TaxID=28903 RepID=UPI003D28DA28
ISSVISTDAMVENHFEYMANSYEDELDKLAYVELIKKTTENMTYLTDDLNKNIYKSIYHEDNLDKLSAVALNKS